MCDAVRLWDIAGRRSVVRYVGHNYPVHSVDAWYDVERFLASSWSKCWKGDKMEGVKPTYRPKIWLEEVLDEELKSPCLNNEDCLIRRNNDGED